MQRRLRHSEFLAFLCDSWNYTVASDVFVSTYMSDCRGSTELNTLAVFMSFGG